MRKIGCCRRRSLKSAATAAAAAVAAARFPARRSRETIKSVFWNKLVLHVAPNDSRDFYTGAELPKIPQATTHMHS